MQSVWSVCPVWTGFASGVGYGSGINRQVTYCVYTCTCTCTCPCSCSFPCAVPLPFPPTPRDRSRLPCHRVPPCSCPLPPLRRLCFPPAELRTSHRFTPFSPTPKGLRSCPEAVGGRHVRLYLRRVNTPPGPRGKWFLNVRKLEGNIRSALHRATLAMSLRFRPMRLCSGPEKKYFGLDRKGSTPLVVGRPGSQSEIKSCLLGALPQSLKSQLD